MRPPGLPIVLGFDRVGLLRDDGSTYHVTVNHMGSMCQTRANVRVCAIFASPDENGEHTHQLPAH
jgi:hypothetical protein